MKTRKKHLIIVLALASVGTLLSLNGCKKSTPSAQAKSIELCTHCGQIKDGDLCCKPGQTKCSGCGLVKGSPGCCNIPEGAKTAAICTECGQIKGTSLCCKPDQSKCPKCGLVKDSPGCCKITEM
jgi:hypothetical protein